MAIDSESSTFLSWEQVQQMQLPPNTTVLVPPSPPTVLTLSDASPPLSGFPEWLDDGYQSVPAIPIIDRIVSPPVGPDDPQAAQSAAEREEYGDPALRMMAGLIATNALLERVQAPPEEKKKENKKDKKE